MIPELVDLKAMGHEGTLFTAKGDARTAKRAAEEVATGLRLAPLTPLQAASRPSAVLFMGRSGPRGKTILPSAMDTGCVSPSELPPFTDALA